MIEEHGIRFFNWSEFDDPSIESGGTNMNSSFLKKLDTARLIAGVPFKINSGWRTPEYNASLPNSSPDSSHLIGVAADIAVASSRDRYKILQALIVVGFHRIGIGQTFIHVDDDITKVPEVVWMYQNNTVR